MEVGPIQDEYFYKAGLGQLGAVGNKMKSLKVLR